MIDAEVFYDTKWKWEIRAGFRGDSGSHTFPVAFFAEFQLCFQTFMPAKIR